MVKNKVLALKVGLVAAGACFHVLAAFEARGDLATAWQDHRLFN